MHETLATIDDVTAAKSTELVAAQPQPIQVVVPRGVFFDVDVALRNVRLGLVIVVIADKILDRVVRQQFAELLIKLGGECLVMRDDQRRQPQPGDGMATVKVLPEPVTPSSVWNRRSPWNSATSFSIACG